MRYQNFLLLKLPQRFLNKLGAYNFHSTLNYLVENLTSRCEELLKQQRGKFINIVCFESLLYVKKIQLAMDLLAIILLAFLILNFLRRSLPWIYKNFIGPAVFGPNVDFSDLGDWSCKCDVINIVLGSK